MALRAILISTAVLLAGCSTQPQVSSETAAADACAARGGTMTPVGRAQTLQCVVRFSDGGKTCFDNAQCQGKCYSTGRQLEGSGKLYGQCAVDSNSFGCRSEMNQGVASPTLCRD